MSDPQSVATAPVWMACQATQARRQAVSVLKGDPWPQQPSEMARYRDPLETVIVVGA